MGVAVGLGLQEFPFREVKAFWRWIDMAEAEGVDSLWQTDRIISREPILECMSTMAALAGRTRRIKFGMNVASIGLRDPLLLAKQCATIDVLSEGRLLPAFGVGNVRGPEWVALGLDHKRAAASTDEALLLLGRLWREPSVDFEGEYFTWKGAAISPRPVNPNIPLWIGGNSAAAVRRTSRYGTGWQAGAETPAQCAEILATIKAATAAEGRTIDDDHYGAAFPFRFGSWDEPIIAKRAAALEKRLGRNAREHFVVGTADDMLARIREYADVGVSKFVLRPMGTDDADLLAQSERLIREVIPHLPS